MSQLKFINTEGELVIVANHNTQSTQEIIEMYNFNREATEDDIANIEAGLALEKAAQKEEEENEKLLRDTRTKELLVKTGLTEEESMELILLLREDEDLQSIGAL